jgi:hypothetical protein
MNKRIQTLINSSYSDYWNLIATQAKWMDHDYLDRKLTHYAAPHSTPYYSPMGLNTHLYHFKDLNWLNFFPALFIRDGLISILHFFYMNPYPNDISTVLIIPKGSDFLVPSAWQEQCITYSMHTYLNGNIEDTDDLYLISTVNKLLFTPGDLERKIKSIQQIPQSKEKNIKGLFFRNTPLGEENTFFQDGHDYDFFKTIHEQFNNEIKVINWEQVKSTSLIRSSFVELNKFDSLYSDSSVSHHFLRNGSISLDCKYPHKEFNHDSCLRLSKFHFFEFKEIKNSSKEKSEKVWKAIRNLSPVVLSGEKNIDRSLREFSQVHLCSKEFESMAKDIIENHHEDL